MRLAIITVLTLLTQWGISQSNLTLSPTSSVTILGTSNVHDWTENCEKVTGSVTVTEENGEIDLGSLSFKVEVMSIKSGKSKMDEYTYEYLLAEQFPVITFVSNQVSTTGTASSTKAVATGTLKIAGQSRPETITATCSYVGNTLKCSGKKVIDMTKYGVEQPSVMFGAMTVGKEVTIQYEIIFK